MTSVVSAGFFDHVGSSFSEFFSVVRELAGSGADVGRVEGMLDTVSCSYRDYLATVRSVSGCKCGSAVVVGDGVESCGGCERSVSRDGESSRVASVSSGCDEVRGQSRCELEGGSGMDRVEVDDGVVRSGELSQGVVSESVSGLRGKHYAKNKAKYEKRKLMRANWRRVVDDGGIVGLGKTTQSWKNACRVDGSGGCVSDGSDGGSVRTVQTVATRTAAEIEAAESLAVRRVAENKVATALAAHKLRALQDKDRTVMVDRLAAARGEQRINEAKEKSQASFKKCDQSLKSLGSSGSAGEFALKQEVKKAKDNEAIRLYVEKQAQMFAKYATPDVLQMVAAIPPPVLQDEFEAFGECPSEYGEEEQQAYFDELNRRNEENFDRCATYC